jgi:superfamily I DNA and/or RNA helicase
MNVALTRAKRKLIVFGDSATLANHSFYKKFLDYVDEKGAYHTAWEIMEV